LGNFWEISEMFLNKNLRNTKEKWVNPWRISGNNLSYSWRKLENILKKLEL
jgi:hypothetical protein